MTLLVVVLGGCSSLSSRDDGNTPVAVDPRYDTTQCPDLGNRRGIVADFVEHRPPEEIVEGEEFSISLLFANYLRSTPVSITLDDGLSEELASGLQAFEQASYQATLDGPTFDNSVRSPGCKVNAVSSQLHLGPLAYDSLFTKLPVQFTGTLKYRVTELLQVPFCLFHPEYVSGDGCADRETLQGAQIDPVNAFLPVYVKTFTKEIITTGDQDVEVRVVITLADAGYSRTRGQRSWGTVDPQSFVIVSPDHDAGFSCTSPQAQQVRDNTLDVRLVNGEAAITCEGRWMGNEGRMERGFFQIGLDYSYQSSFLSDEVVLRPLEEPRPSFPSSPTLV